MEGNLGKRVESGSGENWKSIGMRKVYDFKEMGYKLDFL